MPRVSYTPLHIALTLALGGCVPGILDPIITGGSGYTSESTDPILTSTVTTDGDGGSSSSAPGGSTTGDPGPGSMSAASITATSTATGEPDPSGGDSSGLFLVPDDPPAECGVFTQDCPVGEKCSAEGAWPITSGSITCMPIVPEPDQLGEPCEVLVEGHVGPDTCDIGLFCHDVDPDTGKGTCISLCQGTREDPTCGPGLRCLNMELPLCLSACDPVLQDCPADETCIDIVAGFACWPTPDTATEGLFEGCNGVDSCQPGLVCVNPAVIDECPDNGDFVGCCTSYCDLEGPNTCPGAGQECAPYYQPGEAPAGLEHVGACIGA